MGWIRIESKGNIILTGNGADFHRVSHHEKVCRIFLKGGTANERFQSVGILRREARRLQVSIVKVAQQCCITDSCERGLRRGLSRMKGNFQVRFLGDCDTKSLMCLLRLYIIGRNSVFCHRYSTEPCGRGNATV